MIRSKVIKASAIAKCPTHRMDPGHFRDDGTCECIPAGCKCATGNSTYIRPDTPPSHHLAKCPVRVEYETTGTWVLVELVTNVDYGEGGTTEYKSLGDEVYGPFPTKAAAEAAGKAINDARPYYTWHGRKHRCDLRDFDVFRLTTPEATE